MEAVDIQPQGFDENDAFDWCLWVLDNRLPTLPNNLKKGESVPIARWVGPHLAAVLRAEWSWTETEELEDATDYLASVVQVFRHMEDGWHGSNGDGGGSWHDPPFQLPEIGTREVQVWGTHTSGGEGWWCSAHWGRVGREIASVELVTPESTTRKRIDSPIGAMVVAFDPTAESTIRYLTEVGDVAYVLETEPVNFS